MNLKRKFKGKTLKQWAAFARGGGSRTGTYAGDIHLHRFENEVVVRKMRESGATGPKELAGRYPDLFNTRYLGRAMKRMAKDGVLASKGRALFGGPTYRVKEAGDAKSEAA